MDITIKLNGSPGSYNSVEISGIIDYTNQKAVVKSQGKTKSEATENLRAGIVSLCGYLNESLVDLERI